MGKYSVSLVDILQCLKDKYDVEVEDKWKQS